MTLVSLSDQSSSILQKVLMGLDRQDDGIARYLAHAFTNSRLGVPRSFLDFFGNWTKLIYHKISLVPMPSDFDALLQSASSPAAGKLKIVGPLQLGNIAANALPVLKLGSTGFVSKKTMRARRSDSSHGMLTRKKKRWHMPAPAKS